MNSAQAFSEVPEPDRVEQTQDLDAADDLTGEDAQPSGSVAAVLEADPGDVAEQSVEVDLDDEDRPQD